MIRKRFWVGLALSAVLLSHLDAVAQKQLTVEDIYENPALRGKYVSGLQWMPNSRKFTYYQRDPETGRRNIWSYDVRTRKREIFIDSEKVGVLAEERREKRFTLGNYFWSPDQRHILLPSGNDLYLYDSKTGEVKRLTNDEARERDPQFSPDGKKLAYLKNGNLTVLDIRTGAEKQLTTDASETILIGQFDWVYEEEFGIRTGFFWSPDGKRIAFWRLDQSRVPEFPIVDYIPTHNQVETMRYPKAGDPNSIVQIGVVEVKTGATTWMDLGDNDDIYIPRIKWTKSPRTLAILRLNRDQNHLEFLLADVVTGSTRVLFEERMENGWIDITDDWRFLNDGRHFIWSSRRDGWKHLYMCDLQTGDLRAITRGEWDAVSIVGVDEKHKTIYYMSTEVSPLERHLFGIKFNGKKRWRISRRPGWHRVVLSPNFRYYIDYFPTLPGRPW
ncbi:MAG: DPP IV N-terminal domain-containing protein [candidate division KSB1 bacterium]|nr:DPP IV N-terminal domain-containing protein [candidate division KSB1 bacterium]